ncbi:hypothetical protein DWZ11_00810 [Megamonas rupellensis]|uniref:Uncharacterized protein n=1 Tax=Megamonas rupellensis TaxID=491921 RepID=A0A412A019_9FIRM|nr:hypothetical protein [Megamonas rupellensis]RGQ08432.1 hypothetical protein DWZ11_00810 [Megamonas rupellensis]
MKNAKFKKNDIVIPNVSEECIERLKELYRLHPNDESLRSLINNIELTNKKKIKIVQVVTVEKDDGIENGYIAQYGDIECVYPENYLTKCTDEEEEKNCEEEISNENQLFSVEFYNNKVIIHYKDRNYGAQNIKYTRVSEESINDLFYRTMSLITDLFNRNMDTHEFELKNGIKYYRFNDVQTLNIEEYVFSNTNVICIFDKKIGNYAKTKEELLNKQEEILQTMKEVGV